jgi:hypothetical protein
MRKVLAALAICVLVFVTSTYAGAALAALQRPTVTSITPIER